MELGKQLLLCVNIIMQIREIVLSVYFLLLSGLYLVTGSLLAVDKDQLWELKPLRWKQHSAWKPLNFWGFVVIKELCCAMQILWTRNRWSSLEGRSRHNAEEDASNPELNTIKWDPMMSMWCGAEFCEIARRGRLPESFFSHCKRKKKHTIWPKSALVFSIASLWKCNFLGQAVSESKSYKFHRNWKAKSTKQPMFWGLESWLLLVFTFYAYFTLNISFCISESSHLYVGETSVEHVFLLGFYLSIWGGSHLCSLWLCVQKWKRRYCREKTFLSLWLQRQTWSYFSPQRLNWIHYLEYYLFQFAC